MTKWEYKVIDSYEAPRAQGKSIPENKEITEYLNPIGKDGWELVSVMRTNTDGSLLSFKAFFKRELK
jgi:hypothetical protein